MARRETSENNELLLQDHLSDSVLGTYYRTPDTAERQTYINKQRKRVGKKYVDNSVANRIVHGKKIITGIREGDYERKVGDEYVPFSSDPQAENYFEGWRDWMEVNCADVLTMLAVRVFEMPVTLTRPDEDDPEEDIEKE